MYIQYVYIALKCFHRCRFSRKAEVKWHFCLICVKPLILFSSCGLQKVGWWVAPWSKIQRPHRPFLKSGHLHNSNVVTSHYFQQTADSYAERLPSARVGAEYAQCWAVPAESWFSGRDWFNQNCTYVTRLRQVDSEPTAAPFKLSDPKRNTSQLLLDKTPV